MEEEYQLLEQLRAENTSLRARCRQLEAEAARGAQDARLESAARNPLQVVAGHSPDLLLLVAADGTIQFSNRNRANRAFEPLLTGSLYDALEPRDRSEATECLQRVQRLHGADRFEIGYRACDGRRMRLEANVAPVLQGAEVVAFAITMRDVTHRRRMETAVRCLVEGTSYKTGKAFLGALAEQLALSLDCRYALMAVLRPAGDRLRTVAFWNGDAIGPDVEYDLEGTPCKDVVSQQFCYYSKDVARLFPQDRLLQEMRAESYLGMPLVSTEGKSLGLIAALDVRPVSITPEDRSILRIFAQHASAEIERSAAEEALQQARHNLELAQSRASIGTWTFDPAAGRGQWSSQMYALLNRDPRLGEPNREEFEELLHPEDRPVFQEVHQKALVGKGTFSFDHRTDPGRGPERYLNCTLAVVESNSGERLLVGTSIDITERKRAEKEKEALIRQLEQKNVELERFAYTVSHDLKSPLITIKGFARLLARNLEEFNPSAAAEDLQEISTAADRMTSMLDELLHLSRIGRAPGRQQALSLSDIVDEALVNLSHRLAERSVEVQKPPSFPRVFGDRVRLLEVVQNLVDNAIKFSVGERPTVEVGYREQPSGPPVFFVRDEGIGISVEQQERIFELFEQIDPRGEGSGLGLAIVKRIIDLHGGRIWVESRGRNQGSAFCFTLPQD